MDWMDRRNMNFDQSHQVSTSSFCFPISDKIVTGRFFGACNELTDKRTIRVAKVFNGAQCFVSRNIFHLHKGD